MGKLKWFFLVILMVGLPWTAIGVWTYQLLQGTILGSPLIYFAVFVLASLAFYFLRKARTAPVTPFTRLFDLSFKLGFLLLALLTGFMAFVLGFS
jgi:hypothetical protein